jgi:probable blue pigment (indigoidine) exporter
LLAFSVLGCWFLARRARLDSVGIIAALAGATTMGLRTVLVKRWKRPVSLLVFTAWQLAVGGIVLLPIALVIEGPITHLSTTNLLGFVYLGFVGTAKIQ